MGGQERGDDGRATAQRAVATGTQQEATAARRLRQQQPSC
jgi:hypothetical protein